MAGLGANLMESPAMEVEARSRVQTWAAGVKEGRKAPALGPRYAVLEELGRGGMGIVYRVRDLETDDVVAVKVLRPDLGLDEHMIARFKTELKLSRRVTHRNVCRIHDINRYEDLTYISMEYVEGENLRHVLDRLGALNVRKGVELIRQICEGLQEAHAQGITHRDLKPENIMLDKAGNVKVMDFGIARLASKPATSPTQIMGTPAYMSPEQAEGKPVDARTDIYSLGLLMYETFTGRTAFAGDTPLAVALKQIREKPPDPRNVEPLLPASVENVILRCIEKDPAHRFQSLDEVIAALTSSMSTAIPTPVPTNIPTTRPPWFPETAYVLQPKPARALFLIIQAGYLALYGATLYFFNDAELLLEGMGLSFYVAAALILLPALFGIAARIFLISAAALNHPETGKQFWRLFPALFVLDMLWAASPLLLIPKIEIPLALAAVVGLAYLTFGQKTLVINAYR
jgi:predicted Ser/Thr protein kinase